MSGIAGAIPVLKEGVRWRLEAGHRYIVMQVRRRSKPKNWDRVRVFPGVYGRCLGECDAPGVWLIDVPIDTLADYLGLRGGVGAAWLITTTSNASRRPRNVPIAGPSNDRSGTPYRGASDSCQSP